MDIWVKSYFERVRYGVGVSFWLRFLVFEIGVGVSFIALKVNFNKPMVLKPKCVSDFLHFSEKFS